MEMFTQMNNANKRPSVLIYQFSDFLLFLEESKLQMEALEAPKNAIQKKEKTQWYKVETATKCIPFVSTKGQQQRLKSDKDRCEDVTPHGLKRRRTQYSFIDVENGLEAFARSIGKSKKAQLSFVQFHLNFEKGMQSNQLKSVKAREIGFAKLRWAEKSERWSV